MIPSLIFDKSFLSTGQSSMEHLKETNKESIYGFELLPKREILTCGYCTTRGECLWCPPDTDHDYAFTVQFRRVYFKTIPDNVFDFDSEQKTAKLSKAHSFQLLINIEKHQNLAQVIKGDPASLLYKPIIIQDHVDKMHGMNGYPLVYDDDDGIEIWKNVAPTDQIRLSIAFKIYEDGPKEELYYFFIDVMEIKMDKARKIVNEYSSVAALGLIYKNLGEEFGINFLQNTFDVALSVSKSTFEWVCNICKLHGYSGSATD